MHHVYSFENRHIVPEDLFKQISACTILRKSLTEEEDIKSPSVKAPPITVDNPLLYTGALLSNFVIDALHKDARRRMLKQTRTLPHDPSRNEAHPPIVPVSIPPAVSVPPAVPVSIPAVIPIPVPVSVPPTVPVPLSVTITVTAATAPSVTDTI